MPRQSVCPHCDSPNVNAMPLRDHDGASAVAWHQCIDCARMWTVSKHAIEDPTRSKMPSPAWRDQMLRNA